MRVRYTACVCAACNSRQKHRVYFMGALLVVGFVLIAVFNAFHRTRITTGKLLADDIARLAAIFNRIDATCTILGFDKPKLTINMLTVKKNGFVGSEVGGIHLKKPDQWDGPYLEENPTIQQKEYQLVSTHKGWFVAPGDGVVLPNGKEVGKDIELNEMSNVQQMAHDEELLMFQGCPLALPIHLITHKENIANLSVEDRGYLKYIDAGDIG